ncbi:hypothetical protein K2173_015208 [Erythroxylum novogranatense]|uniref:Response regulatory domain-containing protein n=1 Tax=Erythroxylum novogranatense TaxID=1862640 RepID=A0AAV8T197_9ROSI|nr:hypothetical protein K2173_015208 [Erythroxylum novogranatense]
MVEENNFRVLVVDDDSVVRKIHEMMLSKHGMEVWLAENGKAAVDLHEAGARFNLILMDLETPIMNGREATRQLRAMGVDSAIVGVTSCTSELEQRNFMAAGLNDCVSKPLSIHKIASFLPFTNTKNVITHGCTSSSSNSNRIDNEST